MERIQLTYSKPVVKKAVRAFWRRQVGVTLPLVTVAMAAYAVYLLVSGDRSWLVGAVSIVVLLAVLTTTATYVVNLRRSMTKLQSMGDLNATLTLNDEFLRIESGAGASEMPWNSISRCEMYADFWLVYLDSAVFFTIPTKGLAESELALLKARLTALSN